MPSFRTVSVEEVKEFEKMEEDNEEVDEDEEDVRNDEAPVVFKPTIAKRIQKHRANRMRYGNSFVVPLTEAETIRLVTQLTSFGYAIDSATDKLGTVITVIGKRVE